MEALAAIGAVVLVGGVIALIVRWNKRGQLSRNELVIQTNAMLRRVGDELGLGFVEERAYEHPSQGRFESFGSLHGELHGVEVMVRMSNDAHDDFEYRMQILARTTKDDATQAKRRFAAFHTRYRDGWQVLEPRVKRIDTGPYTHRLIADGAALRRIIEEVATALR